jgi:NitT/TauT family transport system ATP-binding protein
MMAPLRSTVQKGDTLVACNQVSKRYDTGIWALRDCTLEVRKFEFVSLVGASGCGKSTLLKIIAGVEPATSGETLYQGRPVSKINREVGFVTQDSNLFPWLTLRKNVEFPLRMRGIPARESAERAQEWIVIAGLQGFEESYPYQLSGGMQKRGSIIRTLVYNPDVILMDEPFASLDAQTRMMLQNELLEMWARNRSTIIFVTHDLQEAVALSDRVALFSRSPGTVINTFDIPLSRPRDVFEIHGQDKFQETYHEVWQHLRQQFDGQLRTTSGSRKPHSAILGSGRT